MLCAITKQPAKYIDPVTQLPFNSIQAFRIIREAYYQQLEARGDRTLPEVDKWVQWRLQLKEKRKMLLKNTKNILNLNRLGIGVKSSN